MMNEEPYFSLEVREEWKQFFSQQALAYLKSAQDKILYSILDINGFYSVQKAIDDSYKEWNRKLMKGGLSGSVSDVLPHDAVSYFGGDVPTELLLDKIHLNFFSTIHSFFDTYAQFLYRTLFPKDNVPSKLYFYNVKDKISSDSTMVSVEKAIEQYTSQSTYSYISDMDNTNKHSRHVSPETTIFLNDGEQQTDVPAFQKGKRSHDKQPMQDLLEDSTALVKGFFNDVTTEVLKYVRTNKGL